MSKYSTFVDRLENQAAKQPAQTAFTFLQDGETELDSLTYQQLDQEARAIAAVLQNYHSQGERALLLYQPGLEFISAFLGCLYAGVIAVPAYPPRANRSISRLLAIVKDAQAKFALTTESLKEKIESKFKENSASKNIQFVATDKIELNLATDWRQPNLTEDTLAFLQYTSGSTGTPKGVMVSHGNIVANSISINSCFQNTSEHKSVSWLPPYHDMGLIGCIIQPIYAGVSMYMMAPVSFLQRPYRWLEAISRYRANTSGGPNFAYDLCVSQITPEQKETLDLSCWELAFSGAEPVRAETIKKFSAYFSSCGFRQQAFYPCYGMAESTLLITGGSKQVEAILKEFDKQALADNRAIAPVDSETAITLVSSGQNIEGQEIFIVNPDTLTPCKNGEIGEIWVNSSSVAQGYWQKLEQTEATFNAYLADSPQKPFLRTGDLGFLSAGELFVTGRLKDLIIIRGRNYYPQDLELTVDRSHPAVRDGWGAAFAVEIEGKETLVITQEIKRSYLRKLDTSEVVTAIRKRVLQEHELQPDAILLLKTGSIPKTSSGKIQRHACKAKFLENNLSVVGEWSLNSTQTKATELKEKQQQQRVSLTASSQQENQIQSWLVEQLASKLGLSVNEIDIGEPFANYGLDSLQAVRLSADLEDWLGVKLAPTVAYDYPTIASLAEYLAAETNNNKHSSQKLSKTQGTEGRVSSCCVERAGIAKKSLKGKWLQTQSPIAIVGIGCRFPGANNPAEFWKLLKEGKDAISRVEKRWQGDDWGGFVEGVDLFDPQFFGITPRETERMDPQQRLLLEVSWEALENAGIAPEKLAGSGTGVFIGISSSDYSQLQLHYGAETDAYTGTGNAHSIVANRISYFLDLRGPSLAVDTACSSSLVAVHLACQSLQTGECDRAIVGGVNLMLSPELTDTFSLAGMMAVDGRCKTFDAAADGYVRGEGCGVVILKRLEDAVGDRDRILAVIKGSAINQDGRSNGLTAPNGLAQQAVIRQALANAGVAATDIDYIEAHGTGTKLGDPIEVNSLKSILLAESDRQEVVYLGSVKTNIGHLEAAAGIAGLIKTVLCLHNEAIAPNLHFQQLNPHIDLSETPISIPTALQSWTRKEKPRLAGVSSFGFGGTNAHIILQEVVGTETEVNKDTPREDRPLHVLTLSGKSEQALHDLAEHYQDFLQSDPEVNLADVCFTANTGRNHWQHRLAAVASSREELVTQLAAFTQGNKKTNNLISGQTATTPKAKIAFLFTGQGSQYVGMGYQLYQTQPTFRQALERCAAILEPYLEKPLLEVLYPSDSQSDSANYQHLDSKALGSRTRSRDQLDETIYTQPAIFALEYALAQLWLSWGVIPDVVMGHSVGEYVAATIAGVFSLEDGLKLIATRGKLMQSLPHNGEMVAVFASEATISKAIEPFKEQVAIAAINSPQNIVISGEKTAVEQVTEKLVGQEISSKKLNVSHAFHSPLMQPILAEFEQVASQIQYSSPSIPIISNLTGKLTESAIATPEYWIKHVIAPVQFSQGMKLLQEDKYDILLEIGAKPILLGMGRQCVVKTGLWLPSLRPRKEDWQQILQSLAYLYIDGIRIDWSLFDSDYQRAKIALPTYAFQRKSYWLDKNSFDRDIKRKTRLSFLSKNSEKIADLYQVKWKECNQQEELELKSEESSWLILGNETEVSQKIIKLLTNKKGNYRLIYSGQQYQFLEENRWIINPKLQEDWQKIFSENNLGQPDKILYFWSLEDCSQSELTREAIANYQQQNLSNLLFLIQTLYQQSLNSSIYIVTRGTQAITNSLTESSIAASALWGLGKVIASEHPELWGGAIDLAPIPEANEAQNLLKIISNTQQEDHLAIREGKVYAARLQPLTINQNKLEQQNLTISNEHSYLITGGLGALGLKLAQWLTEKGAKNLVLVGRSNPSLTARETISKLEQQGVKILVIQADVANVQEITKVFQQCQSSMPPLKGIIHAAGVLSDGILQRQTWEKFNQVIEPKVMGAWHLHRLSESLPLDFFLLFSSIASLIGSPGQGNYAAANASLDAIATYRQSQGLPALSINWGPWADTGMAISKNFQRQGIELLKSERALATLEQLLLAENQLPQIGIFSVDWEQLSQQFSYLLQTNYFAKLVNKKENTGNNSQKAENESIFQELLAISAPEREKYLTNYLRQAIAEILHIDSEKLKVTDSLLDLGMDSLMVMEAINQLKGDLQLMLYPREFYERPKINSLAKYLANEFSKIYQQNKQVATTSVATSPSKSRKLAPIAFILSSPRSGSTLLRVMLAGHPNLSCPPELHLLPFKTMGERKQKLGISHLGEGLQRALMELKQIDAQESQKLVDSIVQENLPIEEVYRILQQVAGDRLLIDKSPTYASQRETLQQAETLFSNAKYIHLVRHPYAVIESFARMRMDKLIGAENSNPYQLAESIWTESNQNILDFRLEIDSDRYHLVYYEELVAAPEKVMRDICDFLEVPFDGAVLQPYQGKRMTDGVYRTSMSLGDPNFGQHQQIEAKLGETWRKIKLPSPLNTFTQQIAHQLTYELPQEAASNSSSSLPLMQETLLNVRGLRLCLCSWGPEEGPLVLCLHGILEQGAAWSEVAIRLAQKGYRVIAPDLRGHGRSDHVGKGGSYNLMDFLADIDAIVESLADRAFTLVGHSLGSVVAAIFASIRPQQVKNVVLVETVLPTEVEEGAAAEQLATHLDYLVSPPEHPVFPDVEAAAERLLQATPAISKSLAMLLAERITEPCEGGVRWRWSPLLRTRAGIGFNGIGRSRYLGLLRRIKAPITLVYGDKSTFNRNEDLSAQQAAMPNAEKVLLSGGHNLPLEAPSALAKIISSAVAITSKLIP